MSKEMERHLRRLQDQRQQLEALTSTSRLQDSSILTSLTEIMRFVATENEQYIVLSFTLVRALTDDVESLLCLLITTSDISFRFFNRLQSPLVDLKLVIDTIRRPFNCCCSLLRCRDRELAQVRLTVRRSMESVDKQIKVSAS